ncbi:peptidoglycan-binding domain-containing protein [Intestinibacillus massiliensis]|uniref:peptidoglycan-binding domain-containing protein n=1 Tax=Intestinibacillus massiliensis TaxID=1871029 RepID=UPI000B3571E5|nr:peptidoglycan-binding protein [Intestinibacillus massiliensis]
MAYTEAQRRAHVYDLQNALYQISLFDDTVPRVNRDGIFGPETTQSVMELQRRHGLPATGRVDHQTWDVIFAHYLHEMQHRSAPIGITPYISGPLSIEPGEAGAGIGMVQVMLWALSRQFHNIKAVPLTLRYDEETVAQVRNIQRLSGFPPDGILDSKTWNALTILYNVVDGR